MAVWFFYVDESHDDTNFCLSSIAIRHSEWRRCFDEIRNHRKRLKEDFGLYIRKEIHAHEFVRGRGNISDRVIGKWQRSRIFLGLLQLVARMPSVLLFNVCLKKSGNKDPQMLAWDRLVNRIERTMVEMENQEMGQRNALLAVVRGKIPDREMDRLEYRLRMYHPRAFIIADEGREEEITRALRKMNVFNHIPSRFGEWEPGERTKNITTDRLIEDPVLKQSDRSYFIQLADCVAYALLKRESQPTPLVLRYELHKMFDQALAGVCYKRASNTDPLGIVRR